MSCQNLKDTHATHVRCAVYRAQSEVVVTAEHQRKYRYTLQNAQEVCVVDLDGGVFRGKKRPNGETASIADKMLLFCEKETVVLIEFKGKDFHHAISQLQETLQYIGEIIPSTWQVHGRAVCRSIPNVRPSNIEKLEIAFKKRNGTFAQGSNDVLIEKKLKF